MTSQHSSFRTVLYFPEKQRPRAGGCLISSSQWVWAGFPGYFALLSASSHWSHSSFLGTSILKLTQASLQLPSLSYCFPAPPFVFQKTLPLGCGAFPTVSKEIEEEKKHHLVLPTDIMWNKVCVPSHSGEHCNVKTESIITTLANA